MLVCWFVGFRSLPFDRRRKRSRSRRQQMRSVTWRQEKRETSVAALLIVVTCNDCARMHSEIGDVDTLAHLPITSTCRYSDSTVVLC